MKKKIIFSVLLLSVYYTYSQEKKEEINRQYTSIRSLVKKNNVDSTKLKNAIFLKNDTLIVEKSKLKNSYSVKFNKIDSCQLIVYKNLVWGKKDKRGNFTNKRKEIKLWDTSIQVFFDKNVPNYLKKELILLIKKVNNNVDGLKVSTVNSKKESNYFVYITNSKNTEELYPNIDSSKNFSYNFSSNDLNHIYNGALRIDTDRIFNKEEQIAKMKELFIGSLGIFYLSETLNCDSLLSNCYSTNKKLSQVDIDLLNFHYKNRFMDKVNLAKFEKIIEAYKLKAKDSINFITVKIK